MRGSRWRVWSGLWYEFIPNNTDTGKECSLLCAPRTLLKPLVRNLQASGQEDFGTLFYTVSPIYPS